MATFQSFTNRVLKDCPHIAWIFISYFHPFFFHLKLRKGCFRVIYFIMNHTKKIFLRLVRFHSPCVIKTLIRFLVNVMLLQFHFMLLHIRIIYSCFRYQVFQRFTNSIVRKNRYSCFLTSTLRCFFFFSQLIANYEILPICSSLLIYKSI